MGFSLKSIGKGIGHGISGIFGGGGFNEIGRFGEAQGLINGAYGANFWDPLDISGSKGREYEAQQAQLQRDWEKMMSDTAHQREVADLEKAGLNPILSATGGAGASTPSGASASAPGAGGASALGAVLSAFASIKGAQTSAKTAKSNAELNDKTGQKVLNDIKNSDINTANSTAETIARINLIKAQERKELADADAREWTNQANRDLNLTDLDTGTARLPAKSSKVISAGKAKLEVLGMKAENARMAELNRKYDKEFGDKVKKHLKPYEQKIWDKAVAVREKNPYQAMKYQKELIDRARQRGMK